MEEFVYGMVDLRKRCWGLLEASYNVCSVNNHRVIGWYVDSLGLHIWILIESNVAASGNDGYICVCLESSDKCRVLEYKIYSIDQGAWCCVDCDILSYQSACWI
jgi:hypothetical protein